MSGASSLFIYMSRPDLSPITSSGSSIYHATACDCFCYFVESDRSRSGEFRISDNIFFICKKSESPLKTPSIFIGCPEFFRLLPFVPRIKRLIVYSTIFDGVSICRLECRSGESKYCTCPDLSLRENRSVFIMNKIRDL